MLRRWGFDFVVAVVAHRVALVAGEIEHRMAPAVGHKAASVAVVAHRVASVVDMGNFVMEVALHTGWVVTALQAPFHNWCKSVDQR